MVGIKIPERVRLLLVLAEYLHRLLRLILLVVNGPMKMMLLFMLAGLIVLVVIHP